MLYQLVSVGLAYSARLSYIANETHGPQSARYNGTDLYHVCSNYAHGAQVGPAMGVTCFT